MLLPSSAPVGLPPGSLVAGVDRRHPEVASRSPRRLPIPEPARPLKTDRNAQAPWHMLPSLEETQAERGCLIHHVLPLEPLTDARLNFPSGSGPTQLHERHRKSGASGALCAQGNERRRQVIFQLAAGGAFHVKPSIGASFERSPEGDRCCTCTRVAAGRLMQPSGWRPASEEKAALGAAYVCRQARAYPHSVTQTSPAPVLASGIHASRATTPGGQKGH